MTIMKHARDEAYGARQRQKTVNVIMFEAYSLKVTLDEIG